MKKLLLCVIILFLPSIVSATTNQESTVIQNSGLEMRGEGVRSKFFIDLYQATLYASPQMDRAEILSDAGRAIIVLKIVSGMITSEKMESATREGFEKSLSGKNLYTEEIEKFIAVFQQQIVEGDIFIFSAHDKNIEVFKNETLLTTVTTSGFRHALLGIWLGEDPVSTSLKDDMLGQ